MSTYDVSVPDIALYGQNRNANNPELSSGLMATFGWLNWAASPSGHITNMKERTTALLIEQFRVDRPRIVSLVEAVGDLCQEVEDSLFDLIRFRAVGQASGAQLDAIGVIVGIARTDTDDDVYRSDIYFQIYLNRSNGEPETLISALQRVTGAGHVDYCEPTPACVVITANQTTLPIPSNLHAKMEALAAGGVRLDVQMNNATDNFVFNGDVLSDFPMSPYYILANDPYFVGLGFGELMPGPIVAGGGSFTELIS